MFSRPDIAIPRSYSAAALATFFLVSFCIWAFTFSVDPYRLYPKSPGAGDEGAADLFFHLRLHKPYAIERIQPQVLIAGSSRAAGLPPQPLESPGVTAYNAALPGATLREIRQLVEHAHAAKPQKLLLISIDHPMFREGNSDQMAFDERHRYRKIDANLRDRLNHYYQRLVDIWRSLYSVDALLASWQLLAGVRQSASEYHQDGTWDMGVRGATSPSWRYAALISQVYSDEISGKGKRLALDELTELLDFTDAHGIRVILLIAPMQGLLMQTLYLAGTWDDYVQWQRELVALVESRNANTEIYGVEDNAQLVLETINTANPRFQDGVHYTREAGIEIVKCLAGPCDSSLQPTPLDRHSINSYLDQVDALRRQYGHDNPADLKKLHNWLNVKTGNGT